MTLLRLLRNLLVGLALAAVLAVAVVAFQPAHLLTGLGLRLDPLRAPLLLLVTALGATIAAYSVRNLQGQRRLRRFAGLLLLAVLALTCSVLADAVPVLAGSWVVATLAVSGLVAHAGTGAARAASRYVRRWLLLSDGLLIVGLVTAALTSRTTQLSGLATAPSGRDGWLVLAAAFVAAAGVVRSSLVPGSRWLPETAEAPSPVSALLHAGLVNAVGVVSLLVWPLMAQAAVVRFGLVVVGALTAVVATAAMRTRPDVKGRLAASTSSQMGYLAVQVGLGLPAAVLAHVVGHGLWKAGLFLGAGGAVDRVRAGAGAVRDVASLGRRAAVGLVTAVVVLVAAQVPLGLPVLVGEPAELLPLLLATVAVTVAVAHGTRIGPALLAAIGYVIGLRLLTQAIAEAAEPVSFGRVADVLLILALVAAAALLAVVDARASQGRLPALAAGTAWLSLIPSSVAAGSSAGGARRLRRRLRAAGARPLPAPDVEVSAERVEQVRHEVDIASAVVAPAWPLASFVASNPLAGLEGLPFADALEAASRSWTTPPLREGGQDVALQWSRYVANFVTARALADAEWPCPTAPSIWETTRAEGAHVARAVGRPDAGAWLAALPADPAAALAVLIDGRFGGWELSEATAGLAQLLARDPGWAAHLAWRRREGRDGGDAAELLALRLALDVLLDLDRISDAATAHGDNTLSRADRDAAASVVPSVDLTSLEAREEEWRAPVLAALARRAAQDGSATLEAPLGQVVLCIDVRSERLRRQLEALGPWETFGAAGFFGVTLQHESASGAVSARCPALVRPGFAATSAAALPASRPSSAAGVGAVSSAPVLPFALAEASGWVTGPAAVSRTFAPARGSHRSAQRALPTLAALRTLPDLPPLPTTGLDGSPLALEAAADLAAGFLASIGLQRLAPVVMLCGHTGHVANNPHVAAYDCGACGGWSGGDNARAMAALLNDRAVRAELSRRGITFAPGCVVVGAVHDTTSDEVTVLGADTSDSRTPLATLLQDLDLACERVRAERSVLLPDIRRDGRVPDGDTGTSVLAGGDNPLWARGLDWAQPRPEWGLAGNAAFVIGPRALTRGLDLEGRVFLQSYDPAADASGAVLTALMTAPMVVGQWISAQYWASTVAPEIWGAGDKTTHNAIAPARSGSDPTAAVTGVLTGAHGDLRIGLPWQSVLAEQPEANGVGDRGKTRTGFAGHEPLRLLVVVTATPAAIDAVIAAQPSVARLVAGGWISLAAIDPTTGELQRWSDGQWLRWSGDERGHSDAARDYSNA